MPMQNHMWANIWDNHSIFYACGTNSGQRSISAPWILGPYLALVQRKMFIFCALLMLHIRLSGQNFFFTIRHSIIARDFFWLENYSHSKARNVANKITLASHKFLSGSIFLCVIVLGNKVMKHHELHIHGLHATYFGGNLFQSKSKTPDDDKIILLESCIDFEKNKFGYLHGFRRISGAKTSSDCMCCKMCRVINYTKKSQGNYFRACNQLHHYAITPKYCFRINCVMFWDITVGSASLYPIASPCCALCLIGMEAEGFLDYQGRAGIMSIVRYLRLVIFGFERWCFLASQVNVRFGCPLALFVCRHCLQQPILASVLAAVSLAKPLAGFYTELVMRPPFWWQAHQEKFWFFRTEKSRGLAIRRWDPNLSGGYHGLMSAAEKIVLRETRKCSARCLDEVFLEHLLTGKLTCHLTVSLEMLCKVPRCSVLRAPSYREAYLSPYSFAYYNRAYRRAYKAQTNEH